MKTRCGINCGFLVPLLLICLAAVAPGWPGNASRVSPSLRSMTPAGYEVIQLQPSGAVLSLLGLVECTELEGAQHVSEGLDSKILLPDGAQLRRFPRRFSFRVTASLRRTVLDPPTAALKFSQDPAELLLNLKFKLRAYDALVSKEIAPESVTLIGVPADIPYDERVFRVSFDVGERAVTDRFVLEVYSPDGERLGRFPFELL
jgi:hypothetical protein